MVPTFSRIHAYPATPPEGGPVFRFPFRVGDWEAYAGPALADKAAWKDWAATGADWVSAKTPIAPVAGMAPLQRRRADAADRLALEIAFRLSPPGGLPTVFASRHGQVVRSTGMLQAQAAGEPASPMDFSLSVHNATAGQYSIAHGDQHASSSLSARDEAFGSALLEAAGLIAEGAREVLLVASDPQVPEVFGAQAGAEPAGYALGLLLRAAGGEPFDCTLDLAPGPAMAEPQALAFLRALAGGLPRATWSRRSRRWTWERA